MSDETRSNTDEDHIECPHCGDDIDDLSDLDLKDQEHVRHECDNCGESVEIRAHVTTYYTATKNYD